MRTNGRIRGTGEDVGIRGVSLVVSQVDPRMGVEVEIKVVATVSAERQRRKRVREG